MDGLTRRSLLAGAGAMLAETLPGPLLAQGAPAWVLPDLLDKAKAEGGLTVYSSMNEQEALPLWKLFTDATGVPVSYVRASDTQLLSRVAIEGRARQRSWDLLVSTAAVKVPAAAAAQYDVPEAKYLMPDARDKDRRWYGVYAHYNAPAYNTKLVDKADLPKSFEDFATKTQWKGKVAIDSADSQWLSAMYAYFGEDKAPKIVGDLITNLAVVPIDGHLQVARAVASGEYLLALNNYVALTLNMHLSGANTDYFGMDPVPLFFGAVALSAQAPHPNAARLGANFLLSKDAQDLSRKAGRLPTRPDVTPNPPDAITRLTAHKVLPVSFDASEEKIWQKKFQDLFRPR